jgi:hypothetical protein
MSLLGQAIAGGIGAAADTGAGLLNQDTKNRYEAEMEKARELRAMNLARFNQGELNAREDKKSEQQNFRDDQKDTRLQEAEQRKADATLTDYQDADGVPLTRGQVIAASKVKQDAEKVRAEGQSRADEEQVKQGLVEGVQNQAPTAKTELSDALGIERPKATGLLNTTEPTFTPEEQSKIDAADKVSIQSTKAIEAATKRKELAESKKEEIALRAEENRTTAKMHDESLAASRHDSATIAADARRDTASSRNPADKPDMNNKYADQEEMRADKILASVKGTPELMSAPQRTQYNKHLRAAAGYRGEPFNEHPGISIHEDVNNPADVFGGTPEPIANEAESAIAQVLSSNLSWQEKQKRITGITNKANKIQGAQ